MLAHSGGTLSQNAIVLNLVLIIMQDKLCHITLVELYFYLTSH